MTGQFPKRRETDKQAKQRISQLERKRKVREGMRIKLKHVVFTPEWISASGRLMPWSLVRTIGH